MFVVSFCGRDWAFSPEELRPLRRTVRRPRRGGSQGGWAQEVASLPRNTPRSSALSSQTDRSQKAAKAAKLNKTLNKTLKNEYLTVTVRKNARRAALAADATQEDLGFAWQPQPGHGRGVEPARLDARNLGRGKGMGALRPGERAARLAGPGISRVGRGVVESTNLGARRIGRGERVGSGHGTASAAMSFAVLTSISRRRSVAPLPRISLPRPR